MGVEANLARGHFQAQVIMKRIPYSIMHSVFSVFCIFSVSACGNIFISMHLFICVFIYLLMYMYCLCLRESVYVMIYYVPSSPFCINTLFYLHTLLHRSSYVRSTTLSLFFFLPFALLFLRYFYPPFVISFIYIFRLFLFLIFFWFVHLFRLFLTFSSFLC